jgi:putative NADPH-quinone reductase
MRIVAIHGHPRAGSFNRALAEAYLEGAREGGAEVEVLELDALDFDPVLHQGYAEIQPLEPDLVRAQEAIAAADHVLLSFPVWWGAAPAVLKGFFDRTFLPGWAFRFNDPWPLPTRLLKGRSAHVILTMDSPQPVYLALYWRSAHRSVIVGTLRFSGFGPVTQTTVGAVKFLPDALRRWHLRRMRRLGRRHAGRRAR